jgi:hypothetical protein
MDGLHILSVHYLSIIPRVSYTSNISCTDLNIFLTDLPPRDYIGGLLPLGLYARPLLRPARDSRLTFTNSSTRPSSPPTSTSSPSISSSLRRPPSPRTSVWNVCPRLTLNRMHWPARWACRTSRGGVLHLAAGVGRPAPPGGEVDGEEYAGEVAAGTPAKTRTAVPGGRYLATRRCTRP